MIFYDVVPKLQWLMQGVVRHGRGRTALPYCVWALTLVLFIDG